MPRYNFIRFLVFITSFYSYESNASLLKLGEDFSGYPDSIIEWHKNVQPTLNTYRNSDDGRILGKAKNIAIIRVDSIDRSNNSLTHHIVPKIFISGVENIEIIEEIKKNNPNSSLFNLIFHKEDSFKKVYMNAFLEFDKISPFDLFPDHKDFLIRLVSSASQKLEELKEDIINFFITKEYDVTTKKGIQTIKNLSASGSSLNYHYFINDAKYQNSFMENFRNAMKSKVKNAANIEEYEEYTKRLRQGVNVNWPSLYQDETQQTLSEEGISLINKCLEGTHFHSEQKGRFYLITQYENILRDLNFDKNTQSIIISFATDRDPCFACIDHLGTLPQQLNDDMIKVLVSGSESYKSKEIKNFQVETQNMTSFLKKNYTPITFKAGPMTITRDGDKNNSESFNKKIFFFAHDGAL